MFFYFSNLIKGVILLDEVGIMIRNKLLTISSAFLLLISLALGMILEDDLSARLFEVITVLTAVVGAVALFIQFKKDKQVNEASFLMDFGASFYDSYDCADFVYYLDEYATNGTEFSYEEHTAIIVRYMQWVEAIGSIIDSGAASIESIDRVLGYRFFIATNNRIIQENELIPYRFYYMGTFELYEKWYKYRKEHHLPVPLEENSLHLQPLFKEVRDLENKSSLTFKNKKRQEVRKSIKKNNREREIL